MFEKVFEIDKPVLLEPIESVTEMKNLHLYRESMEPEMRRVYNGLEDMLLRFAPSIPMPYSPSFTNTEIVKLFNGVLDDNPLLFYVSRSVGLQLSNYYSIIPEYRFDRSQSQYILNVMQEKALEIGKSAGEDQLLLEYEVNDYLVRNVVYGNPMDIDNQYPDTALIKGHAVCRGISSAASLMLNTLGVRTGIVTGSVQGNDHSWNIVILDGKRYHLDVTNNRLGTGNKVCYRFFNMSDGQLAATHKWGGNTHCKDSSKAVKGYNRVI